MILHGEQSLELLRPLPAEGEFTLKSKVLGVWDKGTHTCQIWCPGPAGDRMGVPRPAGMRFIPLTAR